MDFHIFIYFILIFQIHDFSSKIKAVKLILKMFQFKYRQQTFCIVLEYRGMTMFFIQNTTNTRAFAYAQQIALSITRCGKRCDTKSTTTKSKQTNSTQKKT